MFFPASALGDVCKYSMQGLNPLTTGGALSAGLVIAKRYEKLGHIHHAGVLIHDNHTPGTHNGTDFGDIFIIDRGIHEFHGDTASGRSSGLHGFKLFPVGNASANVIDDLSERGAHGNFHKPGVVYFSHQ